MGLPEISRVTWQVRFGRNWSQTKLESVCKLAYKLMVLLYPHNTDHTFYQCHNIYHWNNVFLARTDQGWFWHCMPQWYQFAIATLLCYWPPGELCNQKKFLTNILQHCKWQTVLPGKGPLQSCNREFSFVCITKRLTVNPLCLLAPNCISSNSFHEINFLLKVK